MPKETVYGDPNDRFVIDVGWNRDMDVQIGIRTADGMHLVDEFYGADQVLEKIGRELTQRFREAGLDWEAPELPDSSSEAAWYQHLGRFALDAVTGSNYGMESLWWHPGRNQINTLIRLLRKARDQAFGKDE